MQALICVACSALNFDAASANPSSSFFDRVTEPFKPESFKFLTLILNLFLPEGIITKGRYCPIFESGLFPQNTSYCLAE